VSANTVQLYAQYQIILHGDKGTYPNNNKYYYVYVWTTCTGLLLSNGIAGSQTHDLAVTSPIIMLTIASSHNNIQINNISINKTSNI